jgi:hypothetical protein
MLAKTNECYLTVLSIMRQSGTYIERYFQQIGALFESTGQHCQLVILEGD